MQGWTGQDGNHATRLAAVFYDGGLFDNGSQGLFRTNATGHSSSCKCTHANTKHVAGRNIAFKQGFCPRILDHENSWMRQQSTVEWLGRSAGIVVQETHDR